MHNVVAIDLFDLLLFHLKLHVVHSVDTRLVPRIGWRKKVGIGDTHPEKPIIKKRGAGRAEVLLRPFACGDDFAIDLEHTDSILVGLGENKTWSWTVREKNPY